MNGRGVDRNSNLGNQDGTVGKPYRQDEPYGESFSENDEGLLDFWQILRVALKWWWLIAMLVIVSTIATFVVVSRQDPLYKAITTIEIKQSESNIIEVSDVEQITANSEFMATQFSLLRSTALAQQVATNLNLTSDPSFVDMDAPRLEREQQAASKIVQGLSVGPVGRSRLINITYVSPSAGTAAKISDAVAENFIAYNLERKYNATSYARDFLEERLAATKAALEKSERDLVRYAEQEGIVNVSGSGSGNGNSEGSGSLDSAALTVLNAEYVEAQSERINLELRYRQAQANPLSEDFQSNPIMQGLNAEKAELESDYQEKLQVLKPEFPEMKEIRSKIETLETRILKEQDNIIASLRAQYEGARAKEASLNSRVQELKDSVISVRNRSIDYNILQREVDTNRSQYDALLQRLKEISITDGVGSNLVSIVDRAKIPEYPFEPNLRRYLIIAFVLSSVIGFGLAFGIELIDDRVKGPDDVKTKLGLSLIGVVPLKKSDESLVELLDSANSSIVEAYASTRTALQFSSAAGKAEIIHITSTRSGEGKSTSSLALAKSFAALEKDTLLIDADMRLPSFSKANEKSIGLSGVLAKLENIGEEIVKTKSPNLYLLPSGITPPNPSELLSSENFKGLLDFVRKRFDYIIIDSPPVLGLADAPAIAAQVDISILIVESGAIRTPTLKNTIERLYASGGKIAGAILMKYKASAHGYLDYYQYSYGKDASKYGESAEGQKSKKSSRVKDEFDLI